VQYGFDPLSPVEADDDPDVDGFSNRQEFYAGSDPLFAASVPAFSPWSTHQGNNRHDGYVPVILDTTALSEIWNRNFSGDDIDDFNQVASDSGVVWATTYLRSRAQSLLAIDGLTGDTIWSYVFDHDSDVTAPSLVDGDVYVQTDEFVYGFRGLTGKQKTRIPFRTEPQVLAAPAVKGGKLYSFAGYDGGTASISTSGKKVIWTHELRTRAGWSPVVKDNRVIFYGNTGLSVLNRTTGNARYVIPDLTRSVSGSRIQPSPVLDAFGNVIVTQHNRVIYFDLESRSIAWETRLGTGDLSQATLANGVVYVVAQGDLVALDANDGSELWRWTPNSPASGQMLATVDHVVLGLENRTVAFNIRTQKVDWKYPLSGELALGNDGILYISGDSSRIAAIRAFGGPDLGGMPGE
jgi:outer membrane protein assembly factor BamB